ncbi:MAG: bifunctional diaminohydroxyphosphoribosylaminopyrimidine deaminase/5-amino-6-(5-phosphoribosylamino)uracil reductase RibD [Flavobacteriaceae bacterium]|nr:bifunctional diaminohydroxyphosphoribosylaminopyrimidine deaminase/5-amino-6-(5-phosphoribosylamino)uracil reductase RibD [Flavobacteriaceae bacterium]
MNIHEKYMSRCIELAKKGLGNTYPNPSVGCVIVYNQNVIGEGFTSPHGSNHAEVNAIQSVEDKTLLSKASIYVTLEPCSHYGKTPPCSDLIIKHQIPTIYIGCKDDNELVAGKGIEKLQQAGCNVEVGVLEQQCKNQHRRFFTFQNKKRPYIILKWAETKDSFIAPSEKHRKDKKPVWITNKKSRQLVHKWRAQEHAILVGTNTVLQDNPSLTTRDWEGNTPVRIVLDKSLKITEDHSVYNKEVKTIIITEKEKSNNENLFFEMIDFSQPIAKQICTVLHKHRVISVIIEGGAKMLQTFIDENLWDEARVFIGDNEFKEGVESPTLKSAISSEENILQDKLYYYFND